MSDTDRGIRSSEGFVGELCSHSLVQRFIISILCSVHLYFVEVPPLFIHQPQHTHIHSLLLFRYSLPDFLPVMNKYEISFCDEHLGDLSCESEKSLGLIQSYLLLCQSKRGYCDTHLLSKLSEYNNMTLRLSKVS